MPPPGTVADLIGLPSTTAGGYASRNLYLPLDDLIKDDKLDLSSSRTSTTIIEERAYKYKGKLYALSYDFSRT